MGNQCCNVTSESKGDLPTERDGIPYDIPGKSKAGAQKINEENIQNFCDSQQKIKNQQPAQILQQTPQLQEPAQQNNHQIEQQTEQLQEEQPDQQNNPQIQQHITPNPDEHHSNAAQITDLYDNNQIQNTIEEKPKEEIKPQNNKVDYQITSFTQQNWIEETKQNEPINKSPIVQQQAQPVHEEKTNTIDNTNENENEIVKTQKISKWSWSVGLQADDLEEKFYEICEKNTEKIFSFFNNIRSEPSKYLAESAQFGCDTIWNSYLKSDKIQPKLLLKLEYVYGLQEVLASTLKSPRSNEEMIGLINNLQIFQIYKLKVFITQCEIEAPLTSVWNLLKQNESIAVDEILTKKYKYCVICPSPIKDTTQMKVYFIILTEKEK